MAYIRTRWYRNSNACTHRLRRQSIATSMTNQTHYIALAIAVLLVAVAGFVSPAIAVLESHGNVVIDSGLCTDSSTDHIDAMLEAKTRSHSPAGHHGNCDECEAEAHCVTCIGAILLPPAAFQIPIETAGILNNEPSPALLETDPNLPERPPRA